MLEHYYSTHETAFYHSVDNDVRSAWTLAYPPLEIDIGRHALVPEAGRHGFSCTACLQNFAT